MILESNLDQAQNESQVAVGQHLQNSFESLVGGFRTGLEELRAVSMLRLEDSAIGLYDKELGTLQKNVRALEDKLKEIRSFIARENQAIKQVKEVAERCRIQKQHLEFIGANLPRHLPEQPIAVTAPEQTDSHDQAGSQARQHPGATQKPQGPEEGGSNHAATDRRKKLVHAPRRYIAESEYGALSSYMTQRLPLSKVNTAVEDAADLAESNMRMLALARAGGKMPTQDWKRAQGLLVNIANKDVVKGRCWMTDFDLRRSSLLKPDKTGKALMTILRHLGRIHEARLPLGGKLESVYVLVPEE